MNNKVFRLTFLIVLIYTYNNLLLAQLNDDKSILSIKGIKNVNLVANISNSSNIVLYFNEEQITRDIEIKFRNIGINVLNTYSNTDTLSIENIINKLKSKDEPYIFFNMRIFSNLNCSMANWLISIVLYQKVDVNSKLEMFSATWDSNHVGMIVQDYNLNLRDRIKDLSDEFVNDYLKANHK